MARTRVTMNSAGIEAMLKGAPGRAAIEGPAESVAAAARASAPVDKGDYRASIKIVADETDRAVARVVADIAYASIVEANTGNMARALGSA